MRIAVVLAAVGVLTAAGCADDGGEGRGDAGNGDAAATRAGDDTGRPSGSGSTRRGDDAPVDEPHELGPDASYTSSCEVDGDRLVATVEITNAGNERRAYRVAATWTVPDGGRVFSSRTARVGPGATVTAELVASTSDEQVRLQAPDAGTDRCAVRVLPAGTPEAS
jgi:hypothetical protein